MLICKKHGTLHFFIMKTHIINNIEFAQKELKLNDSIETIGLKRLAEMLALDEKNKHLAAVHFELTSDCKRFRQPSLHLYIRAQLPVICQRCLGDMPITIDLHFDYLINNGEKNESDDNDEFDWLEANHEMDLQELIEDELLLAMPISLLHEVSCAQLSMQSGEKPNPFAMLKGKIK